MFLVYPHANRDQAALLLDSFDLIKSNYYTDKRERFDETDCCLKKDY